MTQWENFRLLSHLARLKMGQISESLADIRPLSLPPIGGPPPSHGAGPSHVVALRYWAAMDLAVTATTNVDVCNVVAVTSPQHHDARG